MEEPQLSKFQRYHAKHRDEILARRRARYHEPERHAAFLEKLRDDRVQCQHCQLSFGRRYLATHIKKRHERPRFQHAAYATEE